MSSSILATSEYRRALAQFATGVTLVTTCDPQGRACGVTANSFTSVSMEPPLILWSLSLSSSNVSAFRHCRAFRVHVLTSKQMPLARTFATRGADKFSHGNWRLNAHGVPCLSECAAWFECESRNQYVEGDHVILVGRVTDHDVRDDHALVFHSGRYLSTEEARAALVP